LIRLLLGRCPDITWLTSLPKSGILSIFRVLVFKAQRFSKLFWNKKLSHVKVPINEIRLKHMANQSLSKSLAGGLSIGLSAAAGLPTDRPAEESMRADSTQAVSAMLPAAESMFPVSENPFERLILPPPSSSVWFVTPEEVAPEKVLRNELSNIHFNVTRDTTKDLVLLFQERDRAINELLELRREDTPLIPMRAHSLLVYLTEDPVVSEELLKDIKNPATPGFVSATVGMIGRGVVDNDEFIESYIKELPEAAALSPDRIRSFLEHLLNSTELSNEHRKLAEETIENLGAN